MQETEFIAQNKDKWKEFEDVLKSSDKDPDHLTRLFIETTDDLSYSQTHYPNRSVRVYLNSVSQKVYQSIYRNQKKAKNRFSNLWKKEIPSSLYFARKALLFSFLLFTLGIIIGVISDMYYPNFTDIVLSPSYVEMTEHYIESGDPMAVYKSQEPVEMFVVIAINNIQISFGAFVLGLLWGVGTVWLLLSNGIMFGAFMHFFFSRGLWKASFLAVMQHGTLELSMIVVSGAAGFVLAKGILFPGTYSKIESLIIAARNAIKIMIAVFIFLIYAAFIEAFITRLTDLPDLVRVFSILLSMAIVVGYFIVYPRYLYKSGKIELPKQEVMPITRISKIQLSAIKNVSQLFNETFFVLRKSLQPLLWVSFILAVSGVITFWIMLDGQFSLIFDVEDMFSLNIFSIFWCWTPYYYHFDFSNYAFFFPFIILCLSVLLLVGSHLLFLHTSRGKFHITFVRVLNAMVISFLLCLPFLLDAGATFLISIFWWPFCMIWYNFSADTNTFFLLKFIPALQRTFKSFGTFLSLFWTTHSVQWILLLSLNGTLLFIFGFLLTGRPANILILVFDFVTSNIPRNVSFAAEVPYILYTFLLFFILAFVVSISTFSAYLFYHSTSEIYSAHTLISEIKNIGVKKRAYGLEKE